MGVKLPHKQVGFSYFSFVPLSSHLLLSIHQNNSEDYFWVFILLVRMGVIMIKDLGFFLFITISYGSCPSPPNSILTKWVLICAGLELSPRESQQKGIVLFSFVPFFLLFLLFFMMWSSSFLFLFFIFFYLFFFFQPVAACSLF